MMTLDEAIIHCKDVANSKCDKCGEEHRQLAEWLKELKQTRQAIKDIKQEIEALETYEYDDFIRMRAVLDIIDKHISGKEQK